MAADPDDDRVSASPERGSDQLRIALDGFDVVAFVQQPLQQIRLVAQGAHT